MSYTYRLRCRIRQEGVSKAIKYIAYTGYYTIHNVFQNTLLDLKYSRRLLNGNHKSLYKHLGANDTYHTDYSVMPLIFRNVEVTPDDVLVDVGCGKGRVINFWLSRKYTNDIFGLELDPAIAQKTADQFLRYNNIKILCGDAISNLPINGTIFYFYNPFSEEKVKEFENRVAALSETKRIQIIYYRPKSIHVFNNEKWDINHINFERDFGIKRWGRINKYHDLAIITRR